jgi:hypothetical protein
MLFQQQGQLAPHRGDFLSGSKKRSLAPGVGQHARSLWMTLLMVGIEQSFRRLPAHHGRKLPTEIHHVRKAQVHALAPIGG